MSELCRWWSAVVCATLTTTFVGGCGSDGGSDEVDPILELGFYVDGVFEPLMDGSSLPVINAPQGGFWTMPSLRTLGFDQKLAVQVSIDDLVSDENLVATDDDRTFSRGDDGWTDDLLFLPLPSLRTLEDHAAIDGHEATFELVVSDASETLRFEANVLLEAVPAPNFKR